MAAGNRLEVRFQAETANEDVSGPHNRPRGEIGQPAAALLIRETLRAVPASLNLPMLTVRQPLVVSRIIAAATNMPLAAWRVSELSQCVSRSPGGTETFAHHPMSTV